MFFLFLYVKTKEKKNRNGGVYYDLTLFWLVCGQRPGCIYNNFLKKKRCIEKRRRKEGPNEGPFIGQMSKSSSPDSLQFRMKKNHLKRFNHILLPSATCYDVLAIILIRYTFSPSLLFVPMYSWSDQILYSLRLKFSHAKTCWQFQHLVTRKIFLLILSFNLSKRDQVKLG